MITDASTSCRLNKRMLLKYTVFKRDRWGQGEITRHRAVPQFRPKALNSQKFLRNVLKKHTMLASLVTYMTSQVPLQGCETCAEHCSRGVIANTYSRFECHSLLCEWIISLIFHFLPSPKTPKFPKIPDDLRRKRAWLLEDFNTGKQKCIFAKGNTRSLCKTSK